MQEYRLKRAAERPLAFRGELLKEAITPERKQAKEYRGYRMAIYQTDSGKIVTAFEYNSGWKGETAVADAGVFDADLPDLADELRDWFEAAAGFDPNAAEEDGYPGCVTGFPPGITDYHEKQERLLRAMTLEFDRCVSVVLDLPMFEERV